METKRHANPDCKICGGRGRAKTGDGVTQWGVCPCVLYGQRQEAANLMIETHFPARARNMTLARFDTGGLATNKFALKVARNFIDNYPEARANGWVIGFFGPPASGKTHLAVGIAQAIVRRYQARPYLLNVPKALQAERERFRNPDLPSPLAAAASADLLVMDDLGAQYERQADDPSRVSWVTEQLYNLLDERFMNNRPLVYTTNYDPSQLTRRMDNEAGKRVLSRIERAQVIDPTEISPVPSMHRPDEAASQLLLADRG